MLRNGARPRGAPQPKLRCSFCRRSADEVESLVSGARAYICDACITECAAVLEKHSGFGRSNSSRKP